MVRDRRRLDHDDPALTEFVDAERRDLRIVAGVMVDEIVQVAALVGVDPAHRLADRAVEPRIGLGVDLVRSDFGAVIEGGRQNAAALLLGEGDIGLGQRRRLDLPRHHRIETEAGPHRGAAHPDALARQETLEHVEGEVVGPEIERHPHQTVGELLDGKDVRVRAHRDRRVGDDRPPADLPPALDPRILHPAVIAPFAGVVHIRPALLEKLAVARMGIETVGAEDLDMGAPVHPRLAVDPLDPQAFLREQPLGVGNQLA